ncbi:MAG: hypothetical protein GX117_08075 [Candidatus Hydrogenedentes bacterium]|nr:hypothetical protein [Candidatus Hydrogenedentota bacterium]
MKKGCLVVLIILAVLLALVVIGGFVAYSKYDTVLGLSESPVISHEEILVGDPRIRGIVNPLMAFPFLEEYITDDLDLPISPDQVKMLLPYVLPREITLLADSDLQGNQFNLTLFINEQRLGNYLEEQINASNALEKIKQIQWDEEGVVLPQRGDLHVNGTLPIPDSVQDDLVKLWPTQTAQPAARIEGDNQLELVVDNRNGDVLALAAAGVEAAGQSWESLIANQFGATAIGIIESIQVLRIQANFIDKDTVKIHLNIASDEEKGPGLQMLLAGLALPALTKELQTNYALTLKGDLPWDANQNAIIGDLELSGIEYQIRAKLAGK